MLSGSGVVILYTILLSFLIEAHKPSDAGGFIGFHDWHTVSLHNGFVVGLVSTAQLGRHRQLVVEVGKRAIGIERAGVEYRLSGLLDFRLLLGSWISPREVVVDDSS